MKIAVIQHRLRTGAAEDAAALIAAARRAADSGAEIVFFPDVPARAVEENPAGDILSGGLAQIETAPFVPSVAPGLAGSSSLVAPPRGAETLGKIALMVGDASLDREVHRSLMGSRPNVAVLCPRSESELQAEAVLELAIGLSRSLAGLVIVAECSGAQPGEAGHGGSALVLLGDVIAEAMSDDDVIVADIVLPVPQPEPAEALPAVPPILEQRVAHHRGQKISVDYPADLSS
jgi:hypothetical protein